MRDRISWRWLVTLLALGCGPSLEEQPPASVVDVSGTARADEPNGSAGSPGASASATEQPAPTARPSVTASNTVPVPTASSAAAAIVPGRAALVDNVIENPSPLAFEVGTARLRPESGAAIEEVRVLLRDETDINMLRIEVHTDSDGDDKANLKLSDERALAVAKALTSKGVACKRLIAVGFGESRPLAPNDSAQNKAKNRRVTLVVAKKSGKAIGGKPVDGGGHIAGDPCR